MVACLARQWIKRTRNESVVRIYVMARLARQ